MVTDKLMGNGARIEAKNIPAPAVMPVDRQAWKKDLGISNFINCYYEYRDLMSCGGVKRLLLVGPGQGVDLQFFRWLGLEVTTIDIDGEFAPDYVGSVHDLTMFADKQFDAVVASHVLEHLALPYFEPALKELARVARFALVYLPIAGRHYQFRFLAGFREKCWELFFDRFDYFERPDGVTPRYCSNQHFWEAGMRGFRKRDLIKRFSAFFEVRQAYRNPDWNPSLNFVLESKGVNG